MSAYTFETIGSGEAERYRADTDSLQFTAAGLSAGTLQAAYNTSDIRVAVTSPVTGRTVVFGPEFGGESGITFPDGSVAMIGRSIYANRFTGGGGNDGIYGGRQGDELAGGAGNDTLVGGPGGDFLDGGPGADLYIAHPGDAAIAQGIFLTGRDTISDWDAQDRLSFAGLNVTAANYAETTADSMENAARAAHALIAGGTIDVVAVQYGVQVLVFADTLQNNGEADDVVLLGGATLADIDVSRFFSTPVRPAYSTGTTDPAPPTPPPVGAGGGGSITGNMDLVHVSRLIGAAIEAATTTNLALRGPADALGIFGTGFTYDGHQQLVGGMISGLEYQTGAGGFSASLKFPAVSAAPFGQWLAADANQLVFSSLLANADQLRGGYQSDLIRGFGGNDVIHGVGGGDSLFGGDGDDQIFALVEPGGSIITTNASSFLRGEAGDDYIVGGDGFDDMHGNMGDDTVIGGEGSDWVVGGQNNDLLFGDAGPDMVYGNMGDDSCYGGDGADTIRGGQHNDTIVGGAGNDWIAGDRGDDTISGGAGADTFYTFAEAGIDRVLDFNATEGDRVLLDAATSYTARQAGADTVIDMGGGGQLILVGVAMDSLPSGWITTW